MKTPKRIFPAIAGLLLASVTGLAACTSDEDEAGPCASLQTVAAYQTPLAKGAKCVPEAERYKNTLTLTTWCVHDDGTKSKVRASIYLTLDGTAPKIGQDNTLKYESPLSGVPIAHDGMKLQYFAVDRFGNQEVLRSDEYCLDLPPVSKMEPCTGIYNEAIEARISVNEEATVYYTDSGNDPDPDDPGVIGQRAVSAPVDVTVSVSSTIKFLAVDQAGNREKTTNQCSFTIDSIPPTTTIEPPESIQPGTSALVKIRMDDAGTIYYTTNGSVPVKDDPTGVTKSGNLEVSIPINKSTIIRWFSIDKAGNYEEIEGGASYREQAYYFGCKPAVGVNPGGGQYEQSDLDVQLVVSPPGATIEYSIDSAAYAPYNGTSVALNGPATLTLQVRATGTIGGSCTTPQTSAVLTEVYDLGVQVPAQVRTEDFTSTTLIDLANTTALIDTAAGGKATLPFNTASRLDTLDNASGQILPYAPFHKSIFQPTIDAQHVFVVEGAAAPSGSGKDGAGQKAYTTGHLSGSAPNLQYIDNSAIVLPASQAGDEYLASALLQVGGALATTDVVALARFDSIEVWSLASITAPVQIAAGGIDNANTTPGAGMEMLGRVRAPDSVLVYNKRTPNANAMSAYVLGANAKLTHLGTDLLLPTQNPLASLSWAHWFPDDARFGFTPNQSVILGMTSTCQLYRIEASDPGAMAVNPGTPYSGCADPVNDFSYKVLGLQYHGRKYALVSYGQPAGGQNIMLVNVDPVSGGQIGKLLPDTNGLQNPIYDMDIVFVEGEPILLVSGGLDGLVIYDLKNVDQIDVAGGSRIPEINRVSRPGYRFDDVSSGGVPVGGNGEGYFFVAVWRAPVPQLPPDFGSGGILSFRLPAEIRDRADSAVAQSFNINPLPGTNISGIVLQTINNLGIDPGIAVDVKVGPSSPWQNVQEGGSVGASGATDQVFWRATLTNKKLTGEASNPELDRLQFKLTFAPPQ